MFELRDYQKDAIDELKGKINELLGMKSNHLCIFRSPTGSGKTIMMAALIKEIVDNRTDGKEIAFIWIAVHKLHKQSKEKLEKYYEDTQALECSNFNDLQDNQIQDKEILFFNWQSINQVNNIYIRDNEIAFNLSNVIKNTNDIGREIILIIDESHNTADTEKSKELIKSINPKLTINVSATPKTNLEEVHHLVSIPIQKVKDEGMIKKTIRLNYGLDENQGDTMNELILKTALEKRLELKKAYEGEGSDVNPLVLIQLPDKTKYGLDKKDEIVQLLNSKFNINTENGKLGIYLSNKIDKINLENIEKNTNEVEVLIFKQAIAVGWDCPRSAILVLFREWKSFEFSIQTIGRIMRMPEIKHYEHDVLNHAHIYTNIEEVHIIEDTVKNYITTHVSRRVDSLNDDIDLTSTYIPREHRKTRLDKEFKDIFYEIAKKEGLYDKLELNPEKIEDNTIINTIIDTLDKPGPKSGGILIRNIESSDLQNRFDSFLRAQTGGFAPAYSSDRIKYAIYDFFPDKNEKGRLSEIQTIVLTTSNNGHFVDVISRAVAKYRKNIDERDERKDAPAEKWNIPESIDYTNDYVEKGYKKSVMCPTFINDKIDNEKKFMDELENGENVKWWFKNEVGDKKYFAIGYRDVGKLHAFYVDFIIQFNDGRVGLFDTKSGITAEIAKTKAEALSKYIKDSKSKLLFGGIAVLEGNRWIYNDFEKYHYNGDFSDWKHLDLNKNRKSS